MAVTKEHIKKITLPCIAMRGTVAFPGIPMNLEVGRTASKKACDAALDGGGELLLVCQRDQSVEEPASGDIYHVGVTAKIKQLMKADGGIYRLLIEPVSRAEITSFEKKGKYYVAEAMEKTVTLDDAGVVSEALIRDIKSNVAELSAYLPKFSKDLGRMINTIGDMPLLCDFIAANIIAELGDREAILEEFDPRRRAELLILKLEQEKLVLAEETKIQSEVRSRLDRNQRDYYLREQLKVIKEELGDEEEFEDEDAAEYYRQAMKSALPADAKEKLIHDIKKLGKTPFGSAEGGVLRNYIETCLEIPFGKYTGDRMDIQKARKILDADHDGLDEVKDRIIEYLAARKLSSGLNNQVLCLVGPPGTGKTSVASSIARAMNRKFVRVSLGGVRDEADIRGHRKTYIGSMPGRIITALTGAGSMNPLILMDEVDKLTSDAHGDPSSALLEVLDTEQNKAFRDHFIEFPVDLSGCLFITTANTLSTVPQPLIDRMEIVEMKIYTRSEKFGIAVHHLIKKQEKYHGLSARTLRFDDDAVYELIDEYTEEAGVRGLERLIAQCCRRAAKQIVCDGKKSVRITKENLREFAGDKKLIPEKILSEDEVGTVCGMAYTELGGEIMRIEALALDGTGKIELTGMLGDVMKESAQAAISYVRSHAVPFGIDPDFYKDKDIHLHFPEGAVPKDGPSAGVAIAVAMTSELTGIPVKRDVAMTGEITLRGRVLAIGGLREKTMAAYLAGVKTIILPEENRADEKDILPEVKENVRIVYISHVDEAIGLALVREPKPEPKSLGENKKVTEAYIVPEVRPVSTSIEA